MERDEVEGEEVTRERGREKEIDMRTRRIKKGDMDIGIEGGGERE